MKPTYIDLFAGCGGLSLGFRDAGLRCLLAADRDRVAVNAYNKNLKGPDDAGAVVADLGALRTHDQVVNFLHEHGVDNLNCDVLIGGPPCQSFSVVGRNKIRALAESSGNLKEYWAEKNRERTRLFETYALFLEVLAPRWFLFENVPGILRHELFPEIVARFRALRQPGGEPLGYHLEHGVYRASSYGVPQDRRRFLMVGHRIGAGIVGWTPPTPVPAPTVAMALDDLPEVENGNSGDPVPYQVPPTNDYQARMREGRPDVDGPSSTAFAFQHQCRKHNDDDVALFARMGPSARFGDPEVQQALGEINPQHKLLKYSATKFIDKLHRLDPERPSWTITAHMQKDCYKYIHHRQARTITVREAARLQSFPDWYSLEGEGIGKGMGPAFRLIGNAVPPIMAQAFAASFLNSDPALAAADQNLGAAVERVRVEDCLWAEIEQAIPTIAARRGTRRKPDRAVLEGILTVLANRIPWISLPADPNWGTGMTCWRRLDTWRANGTWARVQIVLKGHPTVGPRVDWNRAERRRTPTRRIAPILVAGMVTP